MVPWCWASAKDRRSGTAALHIERTPDHSGAVLHDADPHALVAESGGGHSDAVIMHSQRRQCIDCIQFDADLPGVRVADGIVDGLLGDAEEMQRDSIVCQVERSAAIYETGSLHGGLHFGSHVAQGGLKALRTELERGKSTGQLANLLEGAI